MKKEKLRILAVGDLHGDKNLIKKVIKEAERKNVDIIILAGDTLPLVETKNIIKPLTKINKKILIIPGNWDSFETTDFLTNLYNIKNIHGYAVKYGKIGIFGAGGAVGFNVTENEIFEALKKGNKYLEGVEKKIMVTHMHPANSKSEFSGFKGSEAIKKAIKKFKPDFLIHAHIHEGGGIEEKLGKTKIINVGRKIKIIEV